MLWTWPSNTQGSLWGELDRLHREMNRLFEPYAGVTASSRGNFPAVNVWAGDEDALLTAELPGIDPASLEITVKQDTVTIRGERKAEALQKGESFLRQERGSGNFVRSFALPFHVDAAKVTALYQKGILQVTLPKHEAEKPKKITVNAG